MGNESLNTLNDVAAAFTTGLRLGEGFDDSSFQTLRAAIRACGAEWAGEDAIPKSAAILLVDLWPSIQACAYLYEGQEADRIMKTADEVADLTRAAVTPHNE